MKVIIAEKPSVARDIALVVLMGMHHLEELALNTGYCPDSRCAGA